MQRRMDLFLPYAIELLVVLWNAEAKLTVAVACTVGSGISMPTPIMVIRMAARIEMAAITQSATMGNASGRIRALLTDDREVRDILQRSRQSSNEQHYSPDDGPNNRASCMFSDDVESNGERQRQYIVSHSKDHENPVEH